MKEEQEELAFYMMRCDDQKEELDKFKALFTPGQINMITTGKRVAFWEEEDISPAIALNSAGSKANKMLLLC